MARTTMDFRVLKNVAWQEEAWKTLDFALNTYVREFFAGEITRFQFDYLVGQVEEMAKNYGITPNIEKYLYDLME